MDANADTDVDTEADADVGDIAIARTNKVQSRPV